MHPLTLTGLIILGFVLGLILGYICGHIDGWDAHGSRDLRIDP